MQNNQSGQLGQFRRIKFDRSLRGFVNLANEVAKEVDDSGLELGFDEVSVEDFEEVLKEDSRRRDAV